MKFNNQDKPSKFIKNIEQYDKNGKLVDTRGWYKDYLNSKNKLHKIDGPARMWESGYKEYWLNGRYFGCTFSDDEWVIKQIIE